MKEKTIHKMGNSYSIYLPMSWVKKIESKKVFIEEDAGGSLIIKPVGGKPAPLEKDMVIEDYDYSLVNRIIIWAYRNGLDRFSLKFNKEIRIKQILQHKKRFNASGLPLEIEDISKTQFRFYFQQPLIAPNIVFDNALNLALNVVRAKQQGEEELMLQHNTSLMRNRHILRREFLSAVMNPSVISQFNVSLKSCFDMDNILQHLQWACGVVVEQKISENELENVKKMLELIKAFFAKKEFSYIWRYNEILKKINNENLEVELRRLHRYLISSWIN